MKVSDLAKVTELQRQRGRLLGDLSSYSTVVNVAGRQRPTVTFYHADARFNNVIALDNDAETQAIFALLKARTERLLRENGEALIALGVEI